jgi:hypothetical protein
MRDMRGQDIVCDSVRSYQPGWVDWKLCYTLPTKSVNIEVGKETKELQGGKR